MKTPLTRNTLQRRWLPICLLVPLAAAAQVQTEPVFITAARMPQPQSALLGDVSVVDRAEIERSGVVSVADLLARLPGIEFTRNGGPGTTTSVFVRGAENRHTALYIDGVRVDSQATGGALWEQIPIELVERIEVLRGPAAAVYGSDAIAGVVQLFTRRGSGSASPQASLMAGSYDTWQGVAGVSGAAGIVDYSLAASYGRSDGFSARTDPTANPDADGWRRDSAQARVGVQVAPRHRIDASLLASRLRAQFDGFSPGDEVAYNTLRTGTLAWEGRWSDAATTRFSGGQTRSTYEQQPDFYGTETTLQNWLLQHAHRVGTGTLTAAYERRDDELLNPATVFAPTLEGRRHQDALSLGWSGDLGDHALQILGRRDDDSEFGGQNSGSIAWGWRFMPAWRVTASAATSFRVPTLYQRFSAFGNPSLVPERGRNAELGLRWREGTTEASIVAWRNRVSQLIAFGPPGPCADPFGCYVNVGRAQLDGATLAAKATLDDVALRGSFDWHDPRNLDTGNVLPRRARRFATFAADTQWNGWTFGVELQGAGARWDDEANTVRMGGYGLVNLLASRTLSHGLSFEGRIDNAGDKAYELAKGYATAGRTVQATLRWAM